MQCSLPDHQLLVHLGDRVAVHRTDGPAGAPGPLAAPGHDERRRGRARGLRTRRHSIRSDAALPGHRHPTLQRRRRRHRGHRRSQRHRQPRTKSAQPAGGWRGTAHERGAQSHPTLRRWAVGAAALLLAATLLTACSAARTGLGTTDESCYLALPTAAKAVGGHAHLAGVRKYSLAGMKSRGAPALRPAGQGCPQGKERLPRRVHGAIHAGLRREATRPAVGEAGRCRRHHARAPNSSGR